MFFFRLFFVYTELKSQMYFGEIKHLQIKSGAYQRKQNLEYKKRYKPAALGFNSLFDSLLILNHYFCKYSCIFQNLINALHFFNFNVK